MKELLTAEDFTTPIESLKADLEFIQTYYVDKIKVDEYRIEDRENAERLIDLYKAAIELLNNAEVE